MDDLKTQIDHIEAMVDDNRKMIKGLKRRNTYGMIFHSIKWIIILVVIFGSYYIASPYIQAFQKAYQDIQEAAGAVKGLQEKSSIGNILEGFVPFKDAEENTDEGIIEGTEE